MDVLFCSKIRIEISFGENFFFEKIIFFFFVIIIKSNGLTKKKNSFINKIPPLIFFCKDLYKKLGKESKKILKKYDVR